MPIPDKQADWKMKIIWPPLAIDTTNEFVKHLFLCNNIIL